MISPFQPEYLWTSCKTADFFFAALSEKTAVGRSGLKTDLAMKKALPSQGVFQDASDRRAKDGEYRATCRPTGRVIRVVIVEEDHDGYPFFLADPNATAAEIIEAFADRATIEQAFHDVKEVRGQPLPR